MPKTDKGRYDDAVAYLAKLELDPIKFFPMQLRTDVNVGKSPVCYDGVFNWLFAAGFISRQWLGKHGGDIHAETVGSDRRHLPLTGSRR